MAKPISKKIEKRLKKGAKSLEKSVKNLKPKDGPSAAKIAGVAVAGAAGVAGIAAAVKYLRDGRGAATLHVTPDGADGWSITTEGRDKPVGAFGTKKAAVRAAREEAARIGPSELVIHRADGTIQKSHSYGKA